MCNECHSRIWCFCLNIAKLFAVLIWPLRLFQSRLPLNFNDFVPNLCDLAVGISQSILIQKSYFTTFLVKRSLGGFKWLIALYVSTIGFANFSLASFHLPDQRDFVCCSLILSTPRDVLLFRIFRWHSAVFWIAWMGLHQRRSVLCLWQQTIWTD